SKMYDKKENSVSVVTSALGEGFTAEDYFAVHQLIARYADAADRHDAEQMRSCWTEDGIFIAPGGKEVKTRDGILTHETTLWEKAKESGQRSRHNITCILLVTTSATEVTTRVGMLSSLMTEDGSQIRSTYRSEDVFV